MFRCLMAAAFITYALAARADTTDTKGRTHKNDDPPMTLPVTWNAVVVLNTKGRPTTAHGTVQVMLPTSSDVVDTKGHRHPMPGADQ